MSLFTIKRVKERGKKRWCFHCKCNHPLKVRLGYLICLRTGKLNRKARKPKSPNNNLPVK